MNKLNKILLLITVFLAILLCALVLYFNYKISSPYSAVYLKTGDLYFGKLNYFPSLSLSDVYFVQKNSQNGSYSIQKFDNAFWGPENKMSINKSNIVWTAKLKNDSALLESVKSSPENSIDNESSSEGVNK